MKNKLRVWWMPQIPMKPFYVPVNSVEEGKKVLDMLAAYDLFQLQNNVKPDFCNTGGLQIWDEEENDWCDWYLETEDDWFEDIDDYCDSDYCKQKEELQEFNEALFSQIDYSNLD